VLDLPVLNSFFGQEEQVRVVVQNALQMLASETLTGKYELNCKLPLYTGLAKLNWYESKNGNESVTSESPLMDHLRFHSFSGGVKGTIKKYKGEYGMVDKLTKKFKKFPKGQPTGKPALFVADH
jgi:hypothetical protein